MQVTNFEEVEDQIKFGREAAAAFAKEPKMYSFSRVDLAAAHSRGDYIALRWGLHERAVLILKLDSSFTPFIFGDAVPMESNNVPSKNSNGLD